MNFDIKAFLLKPEPHRLRFLISALFSNLVDVKGKVTHCVGM